MGYCHPTQQYPHYSNDTSFPPLVSLHLYSRPLHLPHYYLLPENLCEGIAFRAEGTAHDNRLVVAHHDRLLIRPNGHGQRAHDGKQPYHDGREHGQRLRLER